MQAAEMAHLGDIWFPEFDKNIRLDEQKAFIFENKCRYDVILGSNFLTKSGIDIKYSDGTMHWFENARLMREPWALDNKEYIAMADSISIQQEDEQFGEDWLDSYLTDTILDPKYEKVDVRDVSSQEKHLTKSQQLELQRVLEKYKELFDDTLWVHPHKKFYIKWCCD